MNVLYSSNQLKTNEAIIGLWSLLS